MQVYVPISAKISPPARSIGPKSTAVARPQFDFAAGVRALPSGQVVAQLRDTINVHLDQQRFAQVNKKNLVYQGGVVLAPGITI